MICPRCGNYVEQERALTCEKCGTLLSDGAPMLETGIKAMRQGRLRAAQPSLPSEGRTDVPEYGDFDMSAVPLPTRQATGRRTVAPDLTQPRRPPTRHGVPVRASAGSRNIAPAHLSGKPVKTRSTNWMLLGIIFAFLAIGLFVGYQVYQSVSPEGRRSQARKLTQKTDESTFELLLSTDDLRQEEREDALKDFGKPTASAYWQVAQEYMDIGDVFSAITAYRLSSVFEPDNYDELLELGAAYEAVEDKQKAEEIYLRLESEVSPSRSEAYTALIRLYQELGRNPEAADMMKLAYESTDKETFRLQRKDFIPLQPQVDLPANRYKMEQLVNITSPQGYDIYYTLDDEAELPAGGILAKGPVTIPEGTLTLRAVCVSEDLVSDPLSATYTIFYPSPSAPYATLAPNTYNKPQTVSLRPGDNENDDNTQLTMYYTIDGSLPDTNSPIFDGTPIQLPNGRVVLRAIAVNGYGKVSSTREVGYKINAKPYMMKMYNAEDDTFQSFTINRTQRAAFEKAFGAPKSEENVTYMHQAGEAKRLEYGWGSATFLLSGNQWLLVRVEMNSAISSGPRGVGIGSTEDEVVAAYKDMGQLPNQDGTRGLYYADPDIGKITLLEDGTRVVQYSCQTPENRNWCLQYVLDGQKRVVKINHFYQP